MTNITNPYLSAKAVAKKKRIFPLCWSVPFCGGDRLRDDNDVFAGENAVRRDGYFPIRCAHNACLSHSSPCIPQSLRAPYRRRAAPADRKSLTFDQLGTVLSSSKALEQLRSLIGTGYLQNLQINAATRTVALYTPEGTFVQWICPGCGAKNSGRRGSAPRCTYCGQPYAK